MHNTTYQATFLILAEVLFICWLPSENQDIVGSTQYCQSIVNEEHATFHEQGNLFLLDDDAHKVGLNIPKREPYYTEWNSNNYGKTEYPAETGNVIIFPSMIFHETGKNTKDIPRLSVSGDIMITMKEGIKSEHNIPSPATWKKL